MFKLDLVSDGTLMQAAAAVGATASGAASILTASWTVEIFGASVSTLLAGFAGSLVALSFLPPYKTWRGMVVAVVAGTLIAAYSEPLIAHYLSAPPKLHQAIAFLVGLVALSVIPLALQAVPEFFHAMADRLRGGGGRGGGYGGGGWRGPPDRRDGDER